jgi:hypothetical protein
LITPCNGRGCGLDESMASMAGRPLEDVEATVRTLVATRLLQNPLGQPAAPGSRGDIVRVTDGQVTIYLLPHEYDAADDRDLRWLLAQEPSRVLAGTWPRPGDTRRVGRVPTPRPESR